MCLRYSITLSFLFQKQSKHSAAADRLMIGMNLIGYSWKGNRFLSKQQIIFFVYLFPKRRDSKILALLCCIDFSPELSKQYFIRGYPCVLQVKLFLWLSCYQNTNDKQFSYVYSWHFSLEKSIFSNNENWYFKKSWFSLLDLSTQPAIYNISLFCRLTAHIWAPSDAK